MKKLILFLLLASSILFANNKNQEFGLTVGNGSGAGISYKINFYDFGLRLTGGYIVTVSSLGAEISYSFIRNKNHDFYTLAGISSFIYDTTNGSKTTTNLSFGLGYSQFLSQTISTSLELGVLISDTSGDKGDYDDSSYHYSQQSGKSGSTLYPMINLSIGYLF